MKKVPKIKKVEKTEKKEKKSKDVRSKIMTPDISIIRGKIFIKNGKTFTFVFVISFMVYFDVPKFRKLELISSKFTFIIR